MPKVTQIKVLDDYRLDLTFDDGQSGIVDVSAHVGKGIFSLWNDIDAFRAVRIGESGELVWDEDIDLCADALYLEITGKRPEDLFPGLSQQDAHA